MLKTTLAITCSFLMITLGSTVNAQTTVTKTNNMADSAAVVKEGKKAKVLRARRLKKIEDKPLVTTNVNYVPHGAVSDPRSRAYALFVVQEKFSLTPEQIKGIDTAIQYGIDQRTKDKDLNEEKLLRKQKKAIKDVLDKDQAKQVLDFLVERRLIGAAMPASGFSGFRRYDLGKPGSPVKDTSQGETSDLTEDEEIQAPVAKMAPPEVEGQTTAEKQQEPTEPAEQAEPKK